jgi:hypothetical protein
LKILLTSAPIFRIVDRNEKKNVFTYACKEGLGVFLSQNGNAICYESRNLKENERHYGTHDLELAAIVHALNMWRHYLMGKLFEIRINNNGLKYFFGYPALDATQSRLLELLSEYDLDIKHIKGT